MFCPECGQPVDPAPFDPRRQSPGQFATIARFFRRLIGSDPRKYCGHRAAREECE